MFLFGEPGNGKISIAERISKTFGTTMWIRRALGIDAPLTGAVVKHRCIAEILSRHFRRAIVSYTRKIFWRTSFKDNFVPTHVRQVT
jgi:replication-associated recombination protein RarA